MALPGRGQRDECRKLDGGRALDRLGDSPPGDESAHAMCKHAQLSEFELVLQSGYHVVQQLALTFQARAGWVEIDPWLVAGSVEAFDQEAEVGRVAPGPMHEQNGSLVPVVLQESFFKFCPEMI